MQAASRSDPEAEELVRQQLEGHSKRWERWEAHLSGQLQAIMRVQGQHA